MKIENYLNQQQRHDLPLETQEKSHAIYFPFNTLWDVVQQDIPQLLSLLEPLLPTDLS